MGSSLCAPRQPNNQNKTKIITSSSCLSNEQSNPFETSFSKKERICLRTTFQRLSDPREIIGKIFVDIVNDICPEFKKIFGVERAPKVAMLKMPKLGGHASRMADFIEQMTLMIGFTENLAGAWQLVRKTGRLHAKVPFLEQNQNQLEHNYIAIVNDHFSEQFIPYLSGEKVEPIIEGKNDANKIEADRRKSRIQQNYSQHFICDVWKRFFSVCTSQMNEAFELERQKCLNADNQKTLAPHQAVEEAERRKRINAERANELEASLPQIQKQKQEELFEDPF
ncbi:hypothetical protein Mgra_00008053 [Meloidogyne graminicola]|uniref:GLOBIN domain-containing protein n=1 Tax=Meloidogyne graminicola TaxID=189291 RepID=A0A8S9ZGW9_9BILA|nr:hypothetical protein Mgra_00008053 [Meloidogyne graminicola]